MSNTNTSIQVGERVGLPGTTLMGAVEMLRCFSSGLDATVEQSIYVIWDDGSANWYKPTELVFQRLSGVESIQ